MTHKFQSACALVLLVCAALTVQAQDVDNPDQAQDVDRYGHALILDEQGWLYIDRDKRPILRPFIFDNGPDYYEEGLARFVENGKMGFHNEALHVVVPAQYDFVFPFKDGVARAGTNCTQNREAEHSYMICQQWETLRNPMRPVPAH